MEPGTELANTVARSLGDIVDSGIVCRTGTPMQLGGTVRQPYASVDYTFQSRTKNLASGGHLSASKSVERCSVNCILRANKFENLI